MLKTYSNNQETNYLYLLNNITTLKKIKIQNLTLISKKKSSIRTPKSTSVLVQFWYELLKMASFI